MHAPVSNSASATTSSGSRSTAVVVLVAVVAFLMCGLTVGGKDGEEVVRPFVWRDVAIVQVACALPLGWVLANLLSRRRSFLFFLGLVAGLLVLAWVAFEVYSIAPRLVPYHGSMARAFLPLALTTVLSLAWIQRGSTWRAPQGKAATALPLALGAAILFVVPATYVDARRRHDAARLKDYLEHSRVEEASKLANRMLALDPEEKWKGQPLEKLAEGLADAVAVLEVRVSRPLPPNSTPRARIERGRQLAMLGQTQRAIETLQGMQTPEAKNLLGAIRETREEWQEALAEYDAARLAWESTPPSPAQVAGLGGAMAGRAYSQRKLARYADAEATYIQLVTLLPTADSHFLLARFYEDTQQAAKAREHSRAAMRLDPTRYHKEGEKLLRKLSVYHFGCLGVFAAERGGLSEDLQQKP